MLPRWKENFLRRKETWIKRKLFKKIGGEGRVFVNIPEVVMIILKFFADFRKIILDKFMHMRKGKSLIKFSMNIFLEKFGILKF